MKRILIVLVICFNALAVDTYGDAKKAETPLNRGVALFQQGKTEEAIREFRRVLEANPSDTAARLNMAYAYERLGNFDQAVLEYQRVIDQDPRNFLARNNLGVLYDKKGLYDEAMVEFQNALKVDPRNATALKNLQNAKENKAALQEREARISQAEKQAQASPADPLASYKLARVYAFHGKKELALEWLAKAIKQGYRDWEYLKVDPALQNIRDDYDFQQLLKKQHR